jgi:hypothetical protein
VSLQSELAAATLRAAAAQIARGGLWGALAYELFVIANAGAQLQNTLILGEIPTCTPGIPASLQACEDPGSKAVEYIVDAVTFKWVMDLILEQINPSEDPNDIVGPVGIGPDGYVLPQTPLSYTINFQNKPEAIGPAAEVVITHKLDDDLDLDTFELSDFGFGDIVVTVPPGRQFFKNRIDRIATHGVMVEVTAQLDRITRTVTWTFVALDPETLDLPISPFVGFLPPDKIAGEGQGFVTFIVRPEEGLATGARIDAQASIIFDTNAPLATNVHVNTIDDGVPASSVSPLPAVVSSANFNVSWAGQDDAGGPAGSGVRSFDVYVSQNGEAFTLWLDDVPATQTSATYNGTVGRSYAFYTIASDNVGHVEAAPTTADAVTMVASADTTPPTSSVAPLPEASPVPVLVSWSGVDNVGGSGIAAYDIFVAVDGGPFTLWLNDTTQLSALYDGTIGHTYAFYSVATDNAGNVEAAPATADASTLLVPPLEPGDYDGDNIVEVDDYEVWRRTFGQTGVGLAADGNHDGVVDAADYTIWRKYRWHIVHDPLGDYNLDGLINKDDYGLWRSMFGQIGTSLAADGNRNGIVDAADYAIWRSRNRSIVVIQPAPASSVASSLGDPEEPIPTAEWDVAFGSPIRTTDDSNKRPMSCDLSIQEFHVDLDGLDEVFAELANATKPRSSVRRGGREDEFWRNSPT